MKTLRAIWNYFFEEILTLWEILRNDAINDARDRADLDDK